MQREPTGVQSLWDVYFYFKFIFTLTCLFLPRGKIYFPKIWTLPIPLNLHLNAPYVCKQYKWAETKTKPYNTFLFLIYQKCFQGNNIKMIIPQSLIQHRALLGRYREGKKVSSIRGLGALLFFTQ